MPWASPEEELYPLLARALEVLARLAEEGRSVAVAFAYLRQGGMDGIELLGSALIRQYLGR